jgi:hypothetical protein
MLVKALAIWLVLMVLAIVNGGLREIFVAPRLGEPAGMSSARSCSAR